MDGAQAQPRNEGCYYVADDTTASDAAEAASRFVFPYRIGQAPTIESRAVSLAFERTIASDVRGIGAAWSSEQTGAGRRYLRPNGLVVDLRISDCEAGLRQVRSYLHELEPLASDAGVASAIATFGQNARQVTRHEYERASPPTPVAVERRSQ